MARRVLLLSVLLGGTWISQAQQVTLEKVVALAMEKNYDVQVATKVAESARTNSDYAWGALMPQVSLVGSRVWNENDQNIQVRDRTTDEIITIEGDIASNNLNGSAQLVWTLFDGTRMFAARQRMGLLSEQSQLAVKDQMANTIAQVIVNYYDIVRQKQQLKAIQEQMSVSEERVKLAERKVEVGTGIKPELLQAKVDYNAQRTQVLQQESLIAQLKEQLNALVGLGLPPVFEVADSIPIDLALDVREDANIENANFALRAARHSVLVANVSLKEARALYSPILNFNAAYNYTKLENTKLINPYGNLFFQQNGYNYGFSFTLPLLNGFTARRLSQQARVEIGRQTLLYQQLKATIDTGLRNAGVNYENAKKILLIEEETIGLARENVFIALASFRRGVSTFIELRTAQQSLADAYNRLIAARYNAKVSETELLRLKGALLKEN